MKLACCVWTLTIEEAEILKTMADLGFSYIDIQPQMLQSDALRQQTQDLGLSVSCVGASFAIPDEVSLDHTDSHRRQLAIDHAKQAITHASQLGAACVYVIPTLDDSEDALQRYADSLDTIAEFASSHQIKIGIEHFPGRALPTALGTLDFIAKINHPNLYLLLDSGHLQMSKEDPRAVIEHAGDRLAYVHLDDNDGEGDLHWALFDGVMTEASLSDLFKALNDHDYDGMVSLELSPNLSQPMDALRASREIVMPFIT